MTYSCVDFVDSILEALGVQVPLDDADNPAAQADLALAEIGRLKEPRKILILQGVHFHVPGNPMSAHATKASADKEAAELVNELFKWIDLPQDAKPETWEADLQRARKARAEQQGCDDPDDLGEDDGDVWITELEIHQ